MTMTDTEAKALALVNEIRSERGRHPVKTIIGFNDSDWDMAFRRAIEREAAAETRHAAELRELKERFSEAVCEWRDACTPVKAAKAAARLHDFILPAPDPLVEAIAAALREASPFADDGHDYTAEAKVAAAAVCAHQKDTGV